MPSWSSRLLHGPQPSSPSTNTRDKESRIARPEIEVVAASSSQQKSPSQQSNNVTQRHERSMSNPFPSVFGQRRSEQHHESTIPRPNSGHVERQDGRNRDNTTAALAVDDVDTGMLPDADTSDSVKVSTRASKSNINERGMARGRCATCDSRLQWPKQLGVFRCTVCLMVNDLQPTKVDMMENAETRGVDRGTPVS